MNDFSLGIQQSRCSFIWVSLMASFPKSCPHWSNIFVTWNRRSCKPSKDDLSLCAIENDYFWQQLPLKMRILCWYEAAGAHLLVVVVLSGNVLTYVFGCIADVAIWKPRYVSRNNKLCRLLAHSIFVKCLEGRFSSQRWLFNIQILTNRSLFVKFCS